MKKILGQFSLKGKVAMITGASRGLGEGMAVGLAEAGAEIIALGRDEEALEQTVKQIHSMEQRAEYYQCDVTDYMRIQEVIYQRDRKSVV